MKKRKVSYGFAYVDLMFNSLWLFIVLFTLVVTQLKLKQKQEEKRIETDGLYAIIMTWPDASKDDVDLYAMDPSGDIAYFGNRNAGLMHLENDDLGDRSDVVKTANGMVEVRKNEERIIIRGAIPGEYVVNAHMYGKRDPGPTPVTVSLWRLKGDNVELVKREHVFMRNGDESTFFRFTLDQEGASSGINELPRKLVGSAADATSGASRNSSPLGGGTSP